MLLFRGRRKVLHFRKQLATRRRLRSLCLLYWSHCGCVLVVGRWHWIPHLVAYEKQKDASHRGLFSPSLSLESGPLDERERELYTTLYLSNLQPVKKTTADILVDLIALQREFPTHFDHKKFNMIWNAFLTTNEKYILPPTTTDREDTILYYTYDKLRYRAAMYVQKFRDGGNQWYELFIKLSNDGYLYSPHDQLEVQQDGLDRHKSKGWCLLEHDDRIEEWFSALMDFAEAWFRLLPGYDADSALFLIFYNYEARRVDFQASAPNIQRKLAITFEHGFPDTPVDQYASKRRR